MKTTANYPVRDVLGVPIAATTLEGALDLIDETISTNGQIQVGVVNAAKIVNMQRDAMLREDVLSSDVIFADGISVVWAGRLLGRPLPERVAGIDLMHGMLERGRGMVSVCPAARPSRIFQCQRSTRTASTERRSARRCG